MARRRGHRRWAVEGCRGAGRSLARRLAADGELVPGVPAKLAARVRVYCRGHGRRGELSALRTRAVRRPRRLLAGLAPGGMRRELTAHKARALPARIRPGGDVARVRLQPARGHLAGIRAPDGRLKTAAAQISALVAATGTTLTALYGAGPVTAGRIPAGTGDVARFATRDKFAGCNGTAPTGVSSGDPAGAGRGGSVTSDAASDVNSSRTPAAFRASARSHPRTVDSGRPSSPAIAR